MFDSTKKKMKLSEKRFKKIVEILSKKDIIVKTFERD